MKAILTSRQRIRAYETMRIIIVLLVLLLLAQCAVTQTSSPETAIVDGVTFSYQPHTLFAPAREVGKRLDWQVHWDGEARTLYLGGREVPRGRRRSLPDGTQVVPLRYLEERKVAVGWNPPTKRAWVEHEDRAFRVQSGRQTVLEGVTFAADPGALHASVRLLGQSLDWPVHWDAENRKVYLNDWAVPDQQVRQLPDGTRLIALRALRGRDAAVNWNGEHQAARVAQDGHIAWVREGAKRVAINRDAQQMRAWQGNLLVLDTRVSTGRPSMPTPTGSFTAGPLKTRMLISRTYGNARMPWSVQIKGDYVIHGFPSVPPRAASHGCVRVPLTGENPAKWFYEWVEVGTPLLIADGWPEEAPASG